MNNEYKLVLEKQIKRLQVLKYIYFKADGNEYMTVTIEEIKNDLKIPNNELLIMLRYLENESLVKPLAMLVEGNSIIPIRLLHQGLVEAEAAITKPHEPTEHFPAQVFNITNNAPIGAQQVGNQNDVNIDEIT
jgi:hypothetical protein